MAKEPPHNRSDSDSAQDADSTSPSERREENPRDTDANLEQDSWASSPIDPESLESADADASDPNQTIDDANQTLNDQALHDPNQTLDDAAEISDDPAMTYDDPSSTLGDPNSTLIDPNATLSDTEQTLDDVGQLDDSRLTDGTVADGTVASDAGPSRTVRDDAVTVRLGGTVSGDSYEELPESNERIDQTIDGNAIDQTRAMETIEIDDESGPTQKTSPSVRLGKADRTVPNSDNPTDQSFEVGSILASRATAVTINPRDLPSEDLDAWNSEVGEVPPPLPPAIERELPEQQSDNLRRCIVADSQSDENERAEYHILGRLGRGGMGDVYVAKQDSLDRLLAVKVIKPLTGRKRAQLIRQGKLESVERERRKQFLSEAIVTSDLDHPNIVPIHDVALTSSGDLFYSMKRVEGTPWSDVIEKKTRDENLEILLKACDAVAFAHTRGVIHRDIKPENIMLGNFGVVLVMDWGLALPTSEYEKQDSIYLSSGLGGTPAFMSPELATGPLDKIGPPADIYLFGATLYMIITGQAPHQGKSVMECLRAVKTNRIEPVPEEQHGELLDIALKAMATDPADRYPDVQSFQQAIRDYRAHAESISLTTLAQDDLASGREVGSYADLSRAAYRFEEAIRFWPGNERAVQGLAETKQIHSQAALAKGDFDLGLSLLDASNPDHTKTINQLQAARRERASRQSRLKTLRRVAVAMLVFILLGGSVAMAVIHNAKQTAELARDSEKAAKLEALESAASEREAKLAEQSARELEEKAKQDALEARDIARTAEMDAKAAELVAREAEMDARQAEMDAREAEAVARSAEMKERVAKDAAIESARKEEAAKLLALEQERLAKAARDEAREAQAAAETARRSAQYEQYVSMIGLAKARLDRNEAEGAREILNAIRTSAELRQQVNRWEWRWLWQQANQSQSQQSTSSPVVDLALTASGDETFAVLSDGSVVRSKLSVDAQLEEPEPFGASVIEDAQISSVAVSPTDDTVAFGTRMGEVILLDPNGLLLQRSVSHQGAVTDVQFSKDGQLITGSIDRTIRLWSRAPSGEWNSSKPAYHLSAVRQIAVAGVGDELRIAVAISDNVSGRIAIWEVPATSSETEGGNGGDTKQWNRIGTMTSHRDVVTTVAITPDGQTIASGDLGGNVLLWQPKRAKEIDYQARIQQAIDLVDKDPDESDDALNEGIEVEALFDPFPPPIASGRAVSSRKTAHSDVIRSLRFSADGLSLLTASDDYTVKLWNVAPAKLVQTFKGHGGWVVRANFVSPTGTAIVSASNDSTIRTWSPETYVSAAVIYEPKESGSRQTQAHRDEILSATFSTDGKRVVTASHDHTARVMEIDPVNLSFRQSVRLEDELLSEGTSFVAMSLGLDRIGERLFVGSADATIRIWDLRLGTQLQETRGTGLNASFAVSNDGQFLLTGSSDPDSKAMLWKIDTEGRVAPEIVHRFKVHTQAVTAFAISPNAEQLFTADRTGLGILWDRESGQPVGEPIRILQGSRVNEATFTPDGNRLLIAGDDEQLTVLGIGDRSVQKRLPHSGLVTHVAAADDGVHVVTVSEGELGDERFSKVSLWNLDTEEERVLTRVSESIVREDRNRVPDQRITSATIDDASSMVVISKTSSRAGASVVQFFSMDDVTREAKDESSLRPVRTFELPSILGAAQSVVQLDANQLITMNRNGGFLWDLRSRQMVKSYRPHATLTEASFSPDGRYVVTASRSIKVWDAMTGKALAKWESTRPIESVQFSPLAMGDAPYTLATGDSDGRLSLLRWEPEKQSISLIRELTESQDGLRRIRRLRFSPDGDRLLVVGDEGRAEVWKTGDLAKPLHLPTDAVNYLCAAVSEDGAVMAAGAADKKIRVWVLGDDPSTQPIELVGHADEITDLKILGNLAGGVRVMSASADDTARVWDPRLGEDQGESVQGREILSLRQHTGDVTSVDATPDGRLLMTGGRDGKVILWPASPAPANLFDK